MLSFFRFLKGYLWIRVSGFSTERFMNLCSNHGIMLWNITPGKDYYEMYISLSGFYRLKPIVKKTGTRVQVKKRAGFPFVWAKWKKRKVFLLGLLACMVSLVILSRFVWAIELNGNQMLTEDMFSDFLVKNHIEQGMLRKDVDIDSFEKALRNEYNFITWTSARIEGTKLVVSVKENSAYIDYDRENLKEEFQEEAWDYVAKTDGVVESIVTRQGVPLVTKGSEVKAGDILISGTIPIMGDDGLAKNYHYVGADGDVYISHSYPYSDKIAYAYEEKHYTGEEKNTYYLSLFHMTLQLFGKPENGSYTVYKTSNQVKLMDDFYLPIYYGTNQYKAYELYEKTYSRQMSQEILKENLNKFCQTLEEKGVQIIEKNVKIEQGKKEMRMMGTLQVIEKAVKKAPVEKQEIPPVSEEAEQ